MSFGWTLMGSVVAQLVECKTWYRGVASSRLAVGRVTVVSLSKTLYPLLNTGSTQEDRKLSRHDCKIVDLDVKH